MKIKHLIAACLPTLMLSMASCQKPIYSEQPEYGDLKFTKAPTTEITLDKQGAIKVSSICDPNDSITVFMQVAYPGDYITSADYIWRLYIDNDSVVSKTITAIAPHKQNTPPMWKFKAPSTSGKYEVTFKAKYDYSAQNANGQIYGESTTHRAALNVR
jgi:hypothetical protein